MNALNKIISLRSGADDQLKVLRNVRTNIYFRGATLWILACAILVASVGLNVNSTAVIIGAMLISPLMGPIIGAGFGLGIYDFILLKRSLKNLFIATIVSLAVSTLYFFLSPFKEAHSEILARTSPNIYDVMIAFFGGLAGVIAVTRAEKGLAIAGVAIATALMPPLCTAGYGLATGNYMYFFGALYLYIINCTFICIATYLIVKFMQYPIVNFLDKKEKRKVEYIITGIVILMIVPALLFAGRLLNKQAFIQKVEKFISSEFINKGNVLIYKNIDYNTSPKTITVAFLSKRYTHEQIDSISKHLPNYGLTNTLLQIKQDTAALRNLSKQNQILNSGEDIQNSNIALAALKKRVEENSFNNPELFSEAKIIFPKLVSFSVSNHNFNQNDSVVNNIPVLVYNASAELTSDEKSKLNLWLRQRLSKDTFLVFGSVQKLK